MRSFDSPYGKITLTNERKKHILTFHPDVAGCIRYFSQALSAPEHVVQSVHDSTVVLCYRFLPTRKKHLAIVVKTGDRPFIVTAYLAKKVKRGIL